MQDAGREQVEYIFPTPGDDGVSGIVATLITNDDIRLFCDEVDDSSLSLVTPVDSGNSS